VSGQASAPRGRRLNWKVLVSGLALVLPLVWVLAAGFGSDPQYIPSPLIDKAAPSFTLPVLAGGGRTVSLEELRGKPTFVNFWATWCDTCGYEHPTLGRLAKAYEGRVNFIGIAYLDTEEKLLAWLRSHGGAAFPTLIDVGTSAAVAYGVGRLPESYLLDKDGIVRHKVFGAVDPTDLVPRIEALL
jgi:cytochrome c biogenesis protein CcmG/thiol:disulfide interchange protein DsbE